MYNDVQMNDLTSCFRIVLCLLGAQYINCFLNFVVEKGHSCSSLMLSTKLKPDENKICQLKFN